MGPDDGSAVRLLKFRLWYWMMATKPPVSVVSRHKAVICLSFDVLEGGEKDCVAERILDKGKAPTGEDPTKANFFQLLVTIMPHVSVSTFRDISCTKADLQGIQWCCYHGLDRTCSESCR